MESKQKTKMLFDSIECINIEQRTSFPTHFHETFCFSLIYEGVNQIDFINQSVFSEAGCISIVNPYEIHSNPLIDKESHIKFDTIYIPSEIMRYVLKGKDIRFIKKKIFNKKASHSFLELKDALTTKDHKTIENHLSKFIDVVKPYSQENKNENPELCFKDFGKISDYIECRICDKFCLEELSKLENINKFGFSKKFKATTGMTPMNYILMRKVFSSKRLINSKSELTEIAYQYNFTDLAHYSKTFKRFIGISPKKYKENMT